MDKKFEDILKKFSPTLRRITHKLNGHFTFFDEDDLFQEALGHLWLASRDGSLNDKTDSYILQGCYFHLKNYIRKTMDTVRLTSISLPIDEDGTTIEDTLAANNNEIENAADEALIAETLSGRGLSEREAKVLSLLLSGMTLREVGGHIGISHVMVMKIKKSIRNKYESLRNVNSQGYQN